MNLDHCRKILEIDKNTSIEDIRRSYRDLVTIWHPDRFTHNPRLREIAERKLKEVNAAYHFLTRHDRFAETGSEHLQLNEKRSHVRKNCRIALDYIVRNRPFSRYRDIIGNISGSGIFIETGKSLVTGRKLFLSFTLPLFGEFSSVSGEIVRITPSGMGVRFNISQRYKNFISNVI